MIIYLSRSILLSQTSPTKSLSLSNWLGLGTFGQLSQASPKPSPSESRWSGLGILGQLSREFRIPTRDTKRREYRLINCRCVCGDLIGEFEGKERYGRCPDRRRKRLHGHRRPCPLDPNWPRSDNCRKRRPFCRILPDRNPSDPDWILMGSCPVNQRDIQ